MNYLIHCLVEVRILLLELKMSTLIIPNNIHYIAILQSFILENARLTEVEESFLARLELVVEESFVYILQNSFEREEEASIKIKVAISSTLFQISFFDEGLPFDASLSHEYKIENFSTEGLEFFLIKKYSDIVEWINHGNRGKEFRLSFKILSKDIFFIDKDKKETPKKETPLKLEDIEIRKFQESDAIKISRIIYKAYGYTYPNENMYYPQKILELNNSGELISIVSYDKKNDEIIGHYGLERPNLCAIAESGQAVVSPKCRGFGLMKKMRDLVEESARDLGIEGIISQPVTSHTFSQQVNESFGSNVCGFSFGLVPKKLSFKQINQTLSQRESCLLYFKALKKRERHLYIPKKYAKIIKNIYTNIDLPYTLAKERKKEQESLLTSNYASQWGIGTIHVKKVGEESFMQIKEAFYKLLFTLKAEVIFLNITLEDTNIENLIQKISKEKFFFAGVHPSLFNEEDYIRFEYLNDTIDASKIQIYSKDAQEIFDYIMQEKKEVLL